MKLIKHIFFIAALYFVSASFALALPIAEEGFESPLTTGSLDTQGSDNGWVGQWTAAPGQAVINGGSDPLDVILPGALVTNGEEQLLSVTGNNDSLISRRFPAQNTDLYLGFSFRANAGSLDFNDFATFCLSTDQLCGDAPTIGFKNDVGPGETDIFVRNNFVEGFYAPDQVAVGEEYYIVGKLSKSTDDITSSYDQFELWVNPDFTDINIESNPEAITTTDTDLSTVEYLNMRSVNLAGSDELHFDSIVMGSEWVDIIPDIHNTLRITEVEYDAVQSGNDGVREWIELYNHGSDPVNLENWSLTDANPSTVTLPSLVLAPGDFALLANNPVRFQENHPGVDADIDLSPSLGLSNAGDTLTLRDPFGNDIDFVAWEGAEAGWDQEAASDAGESICRVDVDIDTDAPEDFIVCENPSPRSRDITAPLAPLASPDLVSDSGSVSDDDITNITEPVFDVVCTEATSEITLFANSLEVGRVDCSTVGSTNVTSSVLVAGSHDITYTETDQFNNTSESSPVLIIEIDVIAPAITDFTADTDGAFSVDMPNIEFTAVDADSGVFQVEASIDSGDFAPVVSPFNPDIPPAESHQVTLRVTDIAGNQSTATIEFPPVVSITSPVTASNAPIVNGSILVNGPNEIISVSVSEIASGLECGVFPQSAPVRCTFQVDTTGVLTVTAEDSTGATGLATRDYIVDQVNPIIVFEDNVEADASQSDSVTVSVSDDNELASFGYVFSSASECNDSTYSSETEILFISGEELFTQNDESRNGQHVCVRAEDTVGNVSFLRSDNQINIDVTVPSLTIETPIAADAVVEGISEPGAMIELTLSGGASCSALADEQGEWLCTLDAEINDGESLIATAVDTAGNEFILEVQDAVDISVDTDLNTGSEREPEERSRRRSSRRRNITQAELDDIFNRTDSSESSQVSVDTSDVSVCTSSSIFSQNMKEGDIDGNYSSWQVGVVSEIAQLQQYLNDRNYLSGPVDGEFGPLTRSAVARLQKDLGTLEDGQFGPVTRSLMETSCGKSLQNEKTTLLRLIDTIKERIASLRKLKNQN